MDRIKSKHSTEAFIYGISRMFERASYYGVRTIVVIYMLSDVFDFDETKVYSTYGFLAMAILISQFIGAVLGDLLLGNKKSIVIGGALQAIGAFVLCLPNTFGLYTGLGLILIGGGLYSPNLISHFGKQYLNKVKLLDSGFSLLYMFINLGAFLGILLIGYFGEINHQYGFIIGGVLMLISISLPLLYKEKREQIEAIPSNLSMAKKITFILSSIFLVAIFWTLYEFSFERISEIQRVFHNIERLNVIKGFLFASNSYFTIFLGVIFTLIWTFWYSSQLSKLAIGFILAAISFLILYFIPEIPTESHIPVYFISLFILSIAEVFISPIVHSVLTKYTNPKYLAIVISLSFIPTKILGLGMGLLNMGKLDISIMIYLKIAIGVSLIIGSSLAVFLALNKKIFND